MSAPESARDLRCDDESFINCTAVAIPEQRLSPSDSTEWQENFLKTMKTLEGLRNAGVTNFEMEAARHAFFQLADDQPARDTGHGEPERVIPRAYQPTLTTGFSDVAGLLVPAAENISEKSKYQGDIAGSMVQRTKVWQGRRGSDSSIFEDFNVDPVEWVKAFTSLVRDEIRCRAVPSTENGGEDGDEQIPVVAPTTEVQFRALRAYDALLAGQERLSFFGDQATQGQLSEIQQCLDTSIRWAQTIFEPEAMSEIADLCALEILDTALAKAEHSQPDHQEPTLESLRQTCSELSDLITKLKTTRIVNSSFWRAVRREAGRMRRANPLMDPHILPDEAHEAEEKDPYTLHWV